MSLLTRLVEEVALPFGTSTTNEQLYDCSCGAPMENTGTYTKGQGETRYRAEYWNCTDDDCRQIAQAYIFQDGSESYGDGPLAGHVEGREL